MAISNFRSRSIINHCQSGGYMLKEFRGKAAGFFLEPGTIRVRNEYAEEAIRSGWLIPRDLDLFGSAMSWAYSGPRAARTNPSQPIKEPS